MVTIAQRIETLRTERNMNRPALAAALGFPKTAIEKFETGRQTPSGFFLCEGRFSCMMEETGKRRKEQRP